MIFGKSAYSAVALVSIVGVAACTDDLSTEAALREAAAARLDIVAGDGQYGEPGKMLPEALAARVLDAQGRPVPGQLVNFEVTSGGGSAFAGAGLSNHEGVVRERWILGPDSGQEQRLEARAVDGSTGEQLVFATFSARFGAPPSEAPAPSGDGIWIGGEELAARATAGAAWAALYADATAHPGIPDVAYQHSDHDVYTLAATLVCARTGEFCTKAREQLLAAIGTEAGGDWLAISRNVGAYAIAADLLGLRYDGDSSSDGSKVQSWLGSFLTRTDIERNGGEAGEGARAIAPFHSGSNAAAQEGFAHAAVSAYMRDSAALQRSWDAFRTYACDPTAPDFEEIDLHGGVESGWAHDDANPCAVNPRGTTKVVRAGLPGAGRDFRIDGAIINDIRRGGEYQFPPGWTYYPWTGLQGFVPAALILHRAGYPAFEVADRAVLRTHEYLWYLRSQTGDARWFDGDRGNEVVQLVNWRYGTSYPIVGVVGRSRTIGFTDWSHPATP